MSTSFASRERTAHSSARVALLQLAVTVAIVPWLIQPGVIQPDTKIDLVVSPGHYLARAFSAWSGHSGFGELQNQAYGYLFPMGPFFWCGHESGMPGWAVQRAWWSLILFVGCLGASLVARRVLHLGPIAAGLCGVLFGLSPRVLTLLSELSIEAWPGALLPWFVLVAHQYLRGHFTGWKFACLVGVLTAACGGVNATASLMPVAGCLLFLLARPGGVRACAWWGLGAAAGAAWWLGPLVVLGRYAYPFMDYIETARITTAVTSVPGILRGASDWVAYIIDSAGHPAWQSGWVIAQTTSSIVSGLFLAGLGLWGLTLSQHRRAGCEEPRAHRSASPFALMLILGTLGMGIAYVGAVRGPFAHEARVLLDGPLAAARNVHKADPLVRLPLALGIGLLVERLKPRRWLVGTVVLTATLVSMTPLWQGRTGDAAGVSAYPASLTQAAKAIDAAAKTQGGSTFVIPSARTAAYSWGTSSDEPLTAFASSPIAWRASAPLVHPGAQRLMDAADANLVSGHDLPATASALSRAGVKRIVIRHGLTPAEQVPSAAAVVAELDRFPKVFTHHRVFGSGETRYDLFDVVGPGTLRTAPSVGVLGGPESTISLAAAGVKSGIAAMDGRSDGWITDDIRKRVYNNGRSVAVAFGPTLGETDRSDAVIGAKDLDYPGRTSSLTTRALIGLDYLDASNSAADPFGRTYLGPGAGPSSAFDADASTAWLVPSGESGVLTFGWNKPTEQARMLTVTPQVTSGARITSWQLTINGHRQDLPASQFVKFTVPQGSRSVSLRPVIVGGDEQATGGIANIALTCSGNSCGTPLAVPQLPGAFDVSRNGVVLSRQHSQAMGRTLRSEDGASWQRVLNVSTGGTVKVELPGLSAKQCVATHVSWAGADLRFSELAGQGCTRRLTVPAGRLVLRMSGPADHLLIIPTSSAAQAALGLSNDPPASQTPRVTAIAQGANAGWTARDKAQAVTIDGWQQGFIGALPRNSVRFAPQFWHIAALAVGALLAGLCLVGTMLPRGFSRSGVARQKSHRPARHQTERSVAVFAGAAFVACSLGGWWGLPGLVLGYLLPLRRRGVCAAVCVGLAGPLMSAFGVVAHASLGAFVGQLLGIWGLTAFVLAYVDVPMRWLGVPRTSKKAMPKPRSRRPSE